MTISNGEDPLDHDPEGIWQQGFEQGYEQGYEDGCADTWATIDTNEEAKK